MNNAHSPLRSVPASPGSAAHAARYAEPEARHSQRRLQAVWARHAEEVEDAQRLRWRVFAQEMGVRLRPPVGTPPGVEVDLFDAHCEHLLLQTLPTDQHPAEVVGTCRVLTPAAARRLGGLYSDTAFDLVRLSRLRPHMAEMGRPCTAPGWRQDGVMELLWSSLGSFMQENGFHHVVGSASVPLFDGGQLAADLWHLLKPTHLAPVDEQVRPRLPLPVDRLATGRTPEVPALINSYLRCGGKLLGEPAWNPDFGTADLPMMLSLADLPVLFARRSISG